MPNWFFYGHTLLWFVVTIIAIFCSNVLGYISFVGSFIGGILMCVFPSLLAMKENGGIKYNLSFSICEVIILLYEPILGEKNTHTQFQFK